ncbi:hypothetical protein F442_18532 [Phytophthora nicotianae P10297]|uniref:Uncharacterized protein n=1 Tax=Phytophthora nicotianae P10297 TaxID=1317064 RepID=W2YF81_PHYNI|nr:hypothetical protein F442_18532 [Phytophthora nicotianae P10297]
MATRFCGVTSRFLEFEASCNKILVRGLHKVNPVSFAREPLLDSMHFLQPMQELRL